MSTQPPTWCTCTTGGINPTCSRHSWQLPRKLAPPRMDALIAEIHKRAESRYRSESPTAERDDVDVLLADRDKLIRRLADAEAELQGLREIAMSGPSTASGPSPLSHKWERR